MNQIRKTALKFRIEILNFWKFLDRNAVRIRSSIVSNLSKINQIFNLSPNQERFVSLTIWVFIQSLSCHRVNLITWFVKEMKYYPNRLDFWGFSKLEKVRINLMTGGTGFKIKKLWFQIILNWFQDFANGIEYGGCNAGPIQRTFS